MATSDIQYKKNEEEQDGGNPDPLSMFKNVLGLGGGGDSGGDYQTVATQDESVESNSVTIDMPDPAGVAALKSKLEGMSSQDKEKMEAQAAKVQALLEAKLATLPPAQRAALLQQQARMQKAVSAGFKYNGSSGDSPIAAPEGGVEEPDEKDPKEEFDLKALGLIRCGDVEGLELLLVSAQADVDVCCKALNDKESHPMLHWAALNDQVEVLEYLIGKKVSLDQRNPRGETALHWAALNGHIRAVHALIDAGCDRMASDARGYSAMHHAAMFGRCVVMACLFRRGLTVDLRDSNGRTPLHWAAYKSEESAAKWLLEHGADVSAEDFEQCLAVHWAALQGSYILAALLVKYGSLGYLGKKDRTGGTPAQLAREKQNKFEKNTVQYENYKRVADYLEICHKRQKDVCPYNNPKPSVTWYAWPVLAPLGFAVYYQYVLDKTAFYSYVTVLFWVFYWSEWFAWTRLQLKDAGTYVIRPKVKQDDPGVLTRLFSRVPPATGPKFKVWDDSTVSALNPGRADAKTARELYLEVLDNGLMVPVCTTCEIVKPLRSKHDRFTDTCVAKFDHYCPFMGVAVGENNYFVFFFAMFHAMVCMLAWLWLSILYTYEYNHSQSYFGNAWELLSFELFVWVLYAPIALYAILMVVQHVMFIRRNITTNEMMNRHRYRYLFRGNPFNRGALKNICEFAGLVDPTPVNLKQYYAFEFSGRSELVERSNAALRGQDPPSDLPDQPPALASHSHSQGGGGHGHSHGGAGG